MPRSCWSLRGSPPACCAHAPCGGSASAIIKAPTPIASPRIERPPDIGGFFGEPTTAQAAREALHVDADLRLPPGLTPRPRLRQPISASAIAPSRLGFSFMTIRIGTSERDGTFYSQG